VIISRESSFSQSITRSAIALNTLSPVPMQLIRLISILIIFSWRVIVISDNMSHKAVDYLNAKEKFTRKSERDRIIASRLSSCRLFELYK